jgi:hypothetical protein
MGGLKNTLVNKKAIAGQAIHSSDDHNDPFLQYLQSIPSRISPSPHSKFLKSDRPMVGPSALGMENIL